MSIYSLLSNSIKKITGIKDFSLLRKIIHKKVGKIIYHQKYSANDLVNVMREMGMKQGSTICIHSSMKEFYNYKGDAIELISAITGVIGTEGTLIMPAFPRADLKNMGNYIFDVNKDKTGAGFLAETFRTYPGVVRSINVRHSVCAWGRNAEWLIKDHHHCHDCWDKDSPWQRMMQLNAIVFNLGLPRSYMGTFHHCVESILQYEHPYWAQFFNAVSENKYYDTNRNIQIYREAESCIERRTRKKKVTRYFNDKDWSIRKLSNLEIKAFYTQFCFPKMLELGRKGISVYYVPSPKKYKF